MLAISFIGRKDTRLFGSQTFGLTTGNTGFLLPDGSELVLCGSWEADRNHNRYPDGVMPDVLVGEPAQLPREDQDPVIQAAREWLVLFPPGTNSAHAVFSTAFRAR